MGFLPLLERGPHDHPALFLGPSVIAGLGVFGAWDVEGGVYGADFGGPIYKAILDRDLPKEIRGRPIQIDADHMQGSLGLGGGYNHSCEPNNGIRWNRELGCYCTYTLRRIPAGEEHTFDYAMCQWLDEVTLYPRRRCRCKSKTCRGTKLGGKSLPDHTVRLYQAQQVITCYNLEQLRRLRAL